MRKKLDFYRYLGLPGDAATEAVERRCQELLRWLEQGNIPEELRPWAQEQAALVEDFWHSFSTQQTVEPDRGELALEAAPPAGVEVSGLKRWLKGPVPFVLLGVLVGLVILAGVVWRSGAGQPAAQVTPAAEEVTSPAQFLAAHQIRIQDLEAVVAKDPANKEALFELGETYMMGEDWEKAILWFTKLVVVEPDNAHAFTDIGIANMSRGRFTEADAAFSQAVALAPEDPRLHFSMGFLYAFATPPNPGEAVKHWQEVVRLVPGTDLAQAAQTHLEQLQGATPSR